MTADTMRKIDRLVGLPICHLLSWAYKLTGRFNPKRQQPVGEVRTLLLVKPAEMGSTVLMHAALRKAREQWPDCEILFLAFSENLAAIDLLGMVKPENVYAIRSDNLFTFAVGTLLVLGRLRKRKVDVALDLEFFSRASAILTALSGAKWTVGLSRYTTEGLYKGDLLTHRVQYNPHIHTAAMFVTLVEAATRPAGECPLVKVPVTAVADLVLPKIVPSPEEIAAVRAIVAQANPAVTPESRLVVLNVNSSDLMPLRRWPLARFIELGRRFQEEQADTFIVLTGVKSERAESVAVEQALGSERCVNLVGKTTLRELLVLYTFCQLMVTNDSGPSHFGCLTSIPTVTLFGPETPELYAPLGPKKMAITSGLACSPCVSAYNHRKSPCTDNLCMKALTVERVWEACGEVMGGR